MESAGFTTRSQIIWAKPSLVMGRGNYHWQHEPCWYGVRKNATAEPTKHHPHHPTMKLTKFVFDGEFIRIIQQNLEAEFAQNHPPTDDLPEILVTCLVWGESAAVFKGVATLLGGAEWQGLLTVTVGNGFAGSVDFKASTICGQRRFQGKILPARATHTPPDKQELRDILDETPSYDPELGLTAAQ